jgi:predicted transcriptional regulator
MARRVQLKVPLPSNPEESGISHQEALDEVRRKIAVGLEQADRGELFDGEEVCREILEKL